MTFFDDDNSNTLPEQPREADSDRQPFPPDAPVPSETSVPPMSATGSHEDAIAGSALKPRMILPEDLRISWSWPHFLIFILFVGFSLISVTIMVLAYLSAARHFTEQQMKQALEDPKLNVGTNVFLFGLVMLFLYITLGVLRGLPFWQSLGWRKLNSSPEARKGRPWMYFFAGSGLAMFVAFASSQVKTTEHMPIQDFFKTQTGALLVMGMAVLVAPLVEETVFRGYLYPFFAGKFSRFAEVLGLDSARAIHAGSLTGVFVTGILFGLVHGSQLGWTWGFVSLLTLVGVIFTFARAWTGTVLASFLLHLGYNSMIAVTSLIATRGFTHMPPGQ